MSLARIILCCAGVATACTSLPAARSAEASFRELGLSRAAFEMSCPADQLAITVLRDSDRAPESRGMSGSQIGVRGCGKKAVYVFAETAGWVLDSAGHAPSDAK